MFNFNKLAMLGIASFFFAQCSSDDTPVAGNGSETDNALTGRIVYEDGSPAAGVSVRIIPVNNVPSFAPKIYEGVARTTDEQGRYSLAGLDTGKYNVEGLKDSLGVFVDSVLADEHIPDGILKKCGIITGITHMEGIGDTGQISMIIRIPGTRRITLPVVGGRFMFDYMPEGDYQMNFVPITSGYSVKIIDLHVTAGQILDLDTILFSIYSSDTVDITTPSVYGVWGPNKTYRIHTNLQISEGLNLTILPNTKVLFMGGFYIAADGNLFAFGSPDSMIEFSTGLPVKTRTSWEAIYKWTQNVATNDTILLKYCIMENSRKGIVIGNGNPNATAIIRNSIFRDCETVLDLSLLNQAVVANNIFKNISHAVYSQSGTSNFLNNIFINIGLVFQANSSQIDVRYNDFFNTDTIAIGFSDHTAWNLQSQTNLSNDPGFVSTQDYHLLDYSPCKGTGFKGTDMGIYDTLEAGDLEEYLSQHNDLPQVFAGNDTSITINDSVRLHGKASSNLGTIIKWEWAAINTGIFFTFPSGDYSFRAPSVPSFTSYIFKATDNNGNSNSDTIRIIYLPDSIYKAGILNGMKEIPMGTFRDVENKSATISYNFWMDSTEVTENQYRTVMGESPPVIKGENMPVTNITVNDAILYCNRLSRYFSLETTYIYSTPDDIRCDTSKNGFRLPSEDEWELACRAGTATRYFWGDSFDSLQAFTYCWGAENAGNAPCEVATKLPNNLNLYDMNGNVGEYCWGDSSAAKPDNRIDYFPSQISQIAIRGGAFDLSIYNFTPSLQYYYSPSDPTLNRGFRCVRKP